MPNLCSVCSCENSKRGHQKAAVFSPPSDASLRAKWMTFINRKDLNINSNSVFLCELHFEEKYLQRNENRVRLIKKLLPVPTIQPQKLYERIPSMLPTVVPPRKEPLLRIFQPDEINSKKYDSLRIKTFSDVNTNMLKHLKGYQCTQYTDHVIYYKLEMDATSIPTISECIRVDDQMHVKLYHHGSPLPLPQWFRHGNDCILRSVTQMENFPAYIRAAAHDLPMEILHEVNKNRFQKRPIYSASIIRYSLMLRYTSLQAYKLLLEQFNLPSVSYLKKLKQGKMDPEKCFKILRDEGKMCEDVILMFDEMFLQKSQEFVGGTMVGCNEDGVLFKGILCFMIVGLRESVPFIIKAIPEVDIKGVWLAEEIKDTIRQIHAAGFNVSNFI